MDSETYCVYFSRAKGNEQQRIAIEPAITSVVVLVCGTIARDIMLYIGLDDTDMPGTRGTGHLARDVASWLQSEYAIKGITRHQLLHDRRIPYTANNSSNVIGIDALNVDLEALADRVAGYVIPQCPEGSDPGLCVALPEQVLGVSFGLQCQSEIVPLSLALETADAHGVLLRSLAGSPCGMIGALAGVCLRASGNDGRYVQVGQIRELTGRVSVDMVLNSGVDRVVEENGREICAGYVETGDKIRPALRDSLVTLFVRPAGPGIWQALKV